MRAVPAVIGISVVIMRISVDFPAPFGPSRPKISPSYVEGNVVDGGEVAVLLDDVIHLDGIGRSAAVGSIDLLCRHSEFLRSGMHPDVFIVLMLLRAALWRRAFNLLWRDQHLRSHAGNVRALGIVERIFQHDGSDVALAAAYVTLGGEVRFRSYSRTPFPR